MDVEQIVGLTKERMGIRTAVRDSYITAIVKSVLTELQDQHKLTLDATNDYHLMFCVDYATWRYESKGENSGMPRHLQFRLHNLLVHVGASS